MLPVVTYISKNLFLDSTILKFDEVFTNIFN